MVLCQTVNYAHFLFWAHTVLRAQPPVQLNVAIRGGRNDMSHVQAWPIKTSHRRHSTLFPFRLEATYW